MGAWGGCLRRGLHRLDGLHCGGLVGLLRRLLGAGLVHLLGAVQAAQILRERLAQRVADGHLADHGRGDIQPVALAGVVLREGHLVVHGGVVALDADAAPAAHQRFAGQHHGALAAVQAAVGADDGDARRVAPVARVALGALGEGLLAGDDGGGAVAVLDEVGVLGEGVQALGLAQPHEGLYLLGGDVARGRAVGGHEVAHVLLGHGDVLAVVGLVLHDLASHGAPPPRT